MENLITLVTNTPPAFDAGAAVKSGLSVVTEVLTFIMGNPICLLLIGISLVPLGFKLFKSMKKSAT